MSTNLSHLFGYKNGFNFLKHFYNKKQNKKEKNSEQYHARIK